MSTGKPDKFLISFSGIDGSGKTTYAEYVNTMLRKKGIKCTYVYGRLEPFLLKPFIHLGRKILLRDKDMFHDYKDYSDEKKKKINEHPLLFKVYYYIMLLDYLIQLLFRVKLPFMMGRSIICDRYIFDTVVTDLSSDLNYSDQRIKKEIDRFFRFFPEPTMSFFIDVPVDVAFSRKDDTPSIKYLEERVLNYRNVASSYNMTVLDGSCDMNEIKDFLLREISEKVVKLNESNGNRY
ncbi:MULTISPECIES: dTMP kinase [Methanothermobacter]|uniref:dTMP kinase n=1 Tax=Methanothermobacter TaxID=145260 RepID=UPI001366F77A|nr:MULTISPECIES: hypothetical protein [Methanothermobacter]MDI6701687.1 hypothetical protein [Methanothermobacter wolfeii]QHN06217.1 hypothetical protein FZP57_03475 [Methanothermobacter sp. THM-1]